VTGLTASEMRIIDEAREVASLRGTDAVRAYLARTGGGDEPDSLVYPTAFGSVQWLLRELAAIAEHHGS
jgi:hypothetical protein